MKGRILALVIQFISLCLAAQPVADFTANKLSGCSPLTVQFTDLSTGGATSWYWSFGNGNNSTIQNPSATYVTPGVYTVSLKATNAAGNDTKTRTAYITVFSSPVANFTAPVVTGCAPLTVNFSNTSTPGSSPITTWLWDYGDGNLGNTQTPTHVYTASGTKNVSLTATDANGCTHNVVKNTFINVTSGFTADFTPSAVFACKSPAAITFTPTLNPANPNYTFDWTTTSGQTSTNQNATLNLTGAGYIGVTLKVKEPNGCIATVTKNNLIQILDLKANFDLPPPPYCASKTFIFTNQSSPDSSVNSYTWSINSGGTTVSKNLSTPLNNGVYNIKLTASRGSCVDDITKTITVSSNPKADYTIAPPTICKVPSTVTFTNTSTGVGLQPLWSFGNNQTSNQNTENVTYNNFLNYTTKLVVTDINGCKDSLTKRVFAEKAEAKLLSQNGFKGCAPFSTRFMIGKDTSFVTYQWSINNSVVSVDSAFNRLFTDTGIYVVQLIATTSGGCVSTVTETVRVGMKINFDFSAVRRFGCYSTMRPVKFNVIENSGINNLKYKWVWRNGGSATDRNPDVFFNDTGNYDIQLTIDHNGCENTIEKKDYIQLYPAKARYEDPEVSCGNDSILFNGNLAIGKNKFLWLFGDGDSSRLKRPYHQYTNSGIYKVKLIVIDTIYNCPDTVQFDVVIPEMPNVKFTVRDSVGCKPLTTLLSDVTTIGPNGYNVINTIWTLSNGQTASGKNANISLTNSGMYGVTITVTDARNCVFKLKRDSVIRVVSGNANFTTSTSSWCLPSTVKFTETTVADYPIVQRRWIWSPTDSSVFDTARTATHIFTSATDPQSAGIPVIFIAKDSFGCEYSRARILTPSAPIPQIQISRNITCGTQLITAAANTSDKNVFAPATYTWNMGGSSNINSSSFSRTFTQLDTALYYQLSIVDANGCRRTKDTTITVINCKPSLGLYANPQKLDCYLPIRPIRLFDTTVIGATPIAVWRWRLGNNTSNLKNPEVTFTKPGTYGVNLYIKDSSGCEDSLSLPDYLVVGGPVGTYNFSPKVGCTPHTANFIVNSPNAKYYIWDFGDGLVDTVPSNSYNYTYTNADEYYPRLTLVDSSGTCAYGYDAIDSIVVHPLPKPDFTADKTVICYNSSVVLTNTTANQPKIKDWLWIVATTDSSKVLGPVTHLFPKAGKFEVSLMATDTNGCIDTIVKPDFITVIDDTIPPDVPFTFRATVNTNTQNQFEFNKSTAIDYSKYRVFYNYVGNLPLNWADVLPIDDTVFLHNNINTLENTYTYGVTATDLCGNQSDTSILHTTVELKASAISNGIALAWTNYLGFDTIKRYEIWRNNPDSGNQFVYIAQTDATTLNYADTNVSCHSVYYYRIKTINQTDTTIFSWSDTSGAVPVFVPTVPNTKNIRVTVVKDSYVLLQWHKRIHKIGFEYAIYRMRDDEQTPQFYKSTKDTFLIDKDVDVDRYSYSYYTYLKDVCGGVSSPSNEAKTILLKVELKQNDILKYDPIISFSNYKHWDDGIKNYQAYFYYDSAKAFDVISSLPITDTTFFHKYIQLAQIDYCYKVEAFNAVNDKVTSESNIACVETKPRLYAPSAFSINGDGVNDKFVLGGVFLETYHIMIYDRWGKLVFESYDIHNSWDGTFDGKACPPDVYVYIAEGTGRRNQQVVIKGNVSLLR